jgi:1,4-dihydroxy-2-naphthoate octaprenyltransferase
VFLLGNAMKFGFFGAFLARLVVFGFISDLTCFLLLYSLTIFFLVWYVMIINKCD